MIESQVFVFCGHGQEVAGVVGSNPGFFVFHQVEDFVHDILLNQGLLLLQLLGACLEGVVFCGVYIVAQEIFGNAECIPGVAKHQDFVGILLIPQQLPASDVCFVHVFGVVDDAHSAPGVGDGVLILRVINGVFCRPRQYTGSWGCCRSSEAGACFRRQGGRSYSLRE